MSNFPNNSIDGESADGIFILLFSFFFIVCWFYPQKLKKSFLLNHFHCALCVWFNFFFLFLFFLLIAQFFFFFGLLPLPQKQHHSKKLLLKLSHLKAIWILSSHLSQLDCTYSVFSVQSGSLSLEISSRFFSMVLDSLKTATKTQLICTYNIMRCLKQVKLSAPWRRY